MKVLQSVLPSLVVAAVLALGGLFLKVSGHEIRLVQVEDHQEVNTLLANSIDKKQDRMMFKLCLLINDGDISHCSMEVH